MIIYVDKLLKHWAQEISINHTTAGLGIRSTWVDMGRTVGSSDLVPSKGNGRYTATGVATRPSQVRGGVGRVAERVDQAVGRLPEHLQAVIDVQYLQNYSNPGERALMLSCSVKKLYQVIHRAHCILSDDLPDSYVSWEASYPPCG